MNDKEYNKLEKHYNKLVKKGIIKTRNDAYIYKLAIEKAIKVIRCCKSNSEQFMCECGESTIYQTKSSNMKWCNKCGKVYT